MEVPGDSQALRDPEANPNDPRDGVGFPHMDAHGMYGLAQHYGVPTRFLDWTFKPLVAAYFACKEAAERAAAGGTPAGHRLAVWALQRNFVDRVCRHWDPGAVTVTVPSSSNPNLEAQGGLFTLVRFIRRDNASVPRADREDIPLLDELLKRPDCIAAARRDKGTLRLPMLYQFTLPHEEARVLLHYLDKLGVNASTVRPGHQSITQYMHEARYRSRRTPFDARGRSP
jgi:hypothetical protein